MEGGIQCCSGMRKLMGCFWGAILVVSKNKMMNLKISIRCLLKLRKQNLIFKLLIPLIQAQVKRKKKKPLLYNLRLRPCFLGLILQFCVGCTIYANSNENHDGCSSPHLARLSCLLPHGLCFLTANKISPSFPCLSYLSRSRLLLTTTLWFPLLLFTSLGVSPPVS